MVSERGPVLLVVRATARITRWAMGVVAISTFIVTGCGPSLPDTAAVEGRVSLDGKPLPTGIIMFTPVHGRPALGGIGEDGTYRLTTFTPDDGAVLGEHMVTISADEVINRAGGGPRSYEEEMQGDRRDGPKPSQAFPELRHIVPLRYGAPATSGLTATVKAQAEPNRIDFDLRNDLSK